MKNTLLPFLAFTISIALIPACTEKQSVKVTTDTNEPMMDHTTKDTMASHDMDNNHDLMSSMTMMMKGMEGMTMSGDFDQDFANMMIMHHQGAIDMSEVALAKGMDAQVKTMAQKIITAQKAEIDQFRQILAAYQAPAKSGHTAGGHDGSHNEMSVAMTTMMTEMKNMQMTGNVDKDYIMMMIPHHQSAITMAQNEISHGNHFELKKMAQKIMSDQQKEIAELKGWMAQH